jgi:cytoskeletal protein RodZ
MADITRFNETIKKAMRAKGVDFKALAEKTDIAPSYIRALLDRSFDHLPATPYVRGYLRSIADVLDVDFDQLWQEFVVEKGTKQSGKDDTLPFNRFASQPINKKTIVIATLVLVALVLIVPRIAGFLGKPGIEVTAPPTNQYQSQSSQFLLQGHVDNPRDKVLINADEAIVSSDGTFSKEVYLEEGQNLFTITARRLLGRSTTMTRTIFYTPAPTAPPTTATSSTSTSN